MLWPRAFAIVALMTMASPCLAAGTASLRQAEKDLKNARDEALDLSKKTKTLEVELRSLQEELASNTKRLQTTEQELEAIEEKQVILQSQLDEKTLNLQQKRKDIASMLTALIRLSGTPAEAAIMMPGDFEATLRAARTMESVSASLKSETQSLRTQLEELEALKAKVSHSAELARKKREAFAARQNALEASIDERQKLQKTLHADEVAQAEKIARLSQQAASLKELITTIETKTQQREEAIPSVASASSSAPRDLRSFSRAKGKIRAPAKGKLLRNFGLSLSINETTRGQTYRTAANAVVVAPYDGEVMFAGPFLNYGKLIILRHTDGYHSLLSGFAELSVRPGQFLLEGEPIGAMGSKKSDAQLYYELRADNQPVDPAPWFVKH